jgi:hypothetical protein
MRLGEDFDCRVVRRKLACVAELKLVVVDVYITSRERFALKPNKKHKSHLSHGYNSSTVAFVNAVPPERALSAISSPQKLTLHLRQRCRLYIQLIYNFRGDSEKDRAFDLILISRSKMNLHPWTKPLLIEKIATVRGVQVIQYAHSSCDSFKRELETS